MVILILLAIFVLVSVFLLVKQVLFNMHMIQLNSYNIDQVFLWYKKNIIKFVLNIILMLASILMWDIAYNLSIREYYSMLSRFVNLFYVIVVASIILVCIIILVIKYVKKSKVKKKFVFTKRIIRNIVLIMIFYIVLLSFFYYMFNVASYYIMYMIEYGEEYNGIMLIIYGLFFVYAVFSFLVSIVPLVSLVTYLAMYPLENIFKRRFINKSKEKLKENDNVNVIGLTGSFGKTSVKNFLYKMLSIKYNTCKTPESYNTPMGLTLTINNNLKNYDEMFIAEMGARRVGDIKELCDIVNPKDAIVTEVGNMHLDTFKNIDNVLKAKMELVDHVVENIKRSDESIILLNGDNELIRKYIEEKNYDDNILDKIFFVGKNEENDFKISNISYDKDGARFSIVTNETDIIDVNEMMQKESPYKIDFTTKLIGLNNIIDISFAIAFAILKGVNVNEIKHVVSNLSQVKNRLEVVKVSDDYILINDAYNSNLVGAKNAIDAVSSFEGYKKVIITPGIVELGDKQKEENAKLSRYAKEKLDYVFMVGKTNKDYLLEGAKDSLYFDRVEEAIMYAQQNVDGKKVVLLENDLTDNY